MKGFLSCRGQLVVEAVVTCLILTLALGLSLELVRRAHRETAGHWVSFVSARQRALGLSTRDQLRRNREFLNRAGVAEGDLDFRETFNVSGSLMFRTWMRYPALFRFPWNQWTKHHFEVTNRCPFPF